MLKIQYACPNAAQKFDSKHNSTVQRIQGKVIDCMNCATSSHAKNFESIHELHKDKHDWAQEEAELVENVNFYNMLSVSS